MTLKCPDIDIRSCLLELENSRTHAEKALGQVRGMRMFRRTYLQRLRVLDDMIALCRGYQDEIQSMY